MNEIIDENFGKKFGRLTVMSGLHKPSKLKSSSFVYTCKCDCGNITEVRKHSLVNGIKISCGCIHLPDLIGKRFGKLTVTEYLGLRKRKNEDTNDRYWKCRCDCGGYVEVSTISLKKGYVKTCGCGRQHVEIGKKYGKLIPFAQVFPYVPSKGKRFKCKCDCGNITEVSGHYLTSGKIQSCGCLHDEVCIRYRTDEERYWADRFHNIKQRCYNKNNKHYARYGGRGIYVCDEWLKDPLKFVRYVIDNGYRRCDEIDRFPDNDGPYAPNNCRPSSKLQQGNNRSDNHLLTVGNRSSTVSMWARSINVPIQTLFSIIRNHGDSVAKETIEKELNMVRSAASEMKSRLTEFADDIYSRIKPIV